MKKVTLIKNVRVGENYTFEEREYMKENNVQIVNSFLEPKGNNTYDLVVTVK